MRKVPLIFSILLLASSQIVLGQQILLQEGMRSYQQGDYELSIDLLEKVIQKDSLQLNAYVLLSASYLKQETPELAQLRAEQGLRHFPNAGSLLWLQAEALFQQQLVEKALPLYEKIRDKPAGQKKMKPLQVTDSHIKQRLVQGNKILASQAFQRDDLDKARNYISRVQELAPGDPEIQKNLAFLYLRQEEWERALKAVNKALDKNPKDRDLLRMKASALYNLKDYEGLRNEYKVLYQQDPNDIETALTYAEILIGSQKSSEAEKIYKQLLEEYPDDRRIYEALIDVNDRRFNIQGKREVLRRMEKQFPEDRSISGDIANSFEQEEKWGKARAVYDSLLSTGENTLSLKKNIARTYVEQDSLKEAERLYWQLYQNNETDKALVLRLGEVLEQSENWVEAQSLYQKFLLKSDDKEVFHRLGMVEMKLENEQEAIINFRKAIENGSSDPEVYLRLSELLSKGNLSQRKRAREQSSLALILSLEALKENQKKIEQQLSQNALGGQLQNEQQFERLSKLDALAEEAFLNFTAINSKETIHRMFNELESDYSGSGRLFYLIGNYYDRERQFEKAKSHYQKSIRYTPKLREAHLAYARLLEQNGHYKSAIVSYERTLALDPQQPEAYDALIRLYRQQGNLDDLCNRWMSRFRGNVDNEVLKEFLIEALHKAGRFDEASEIIDR